MALLLRLTLPGKNSLDDWRAANLDDGPENCLNKVRSWCLEKNVPAVNYSKTGDL